MFCPNCGNQIPDGSAFCTVCGAKQEAKRGYQRGQQAFGGRAAKTAAKKAGGGFGKKLVSLALAGVVIYGGVSLLGDEPDDPKPVTPQPGQIETNDPNGGGTGGEIAAPKDGMQYYLGQYYTYPADGGDAERSYELVAIEFDSDAHLALLHPYDGLESEADAVFNWSGTSLSPYGYAGAQGGEMSLRIDWGNIIKGHGKADGVTTYFRFTPISLLSDGTWLVSETDETFPYDREDLLVDNSTVDGNFMREVRAYAAAYGLRMATADVQSEDKKDNTGDISATNQLTDEMLEYYIKLEGERHIREYMDWSDDPEYFTPAEHMQIPSNQRGITQAEFERRADEYAKQHGLSDYVPLETWKN